VYQVLNRKGLFRINLLSDVSVSRYQHFFTEQPAQLFQWVVTDKLCSVMTFSRKTTVRESDVSVIFRNVM
jgi:hypothetical protein